MFRRAHIPDEISVVETMSASSKGKRNQINLLDVKDLRNRSYRPFTFDNDVLFCSKTRLIYTAVSKNGCSTMKAFLYHLENFPKKLPHNVSPHNRSETGLKGADIIGDANFEKILSDSSVPKITIVRNPFLRVVSCYLNRISDFGTEAYDFNRRFDEWIHNRVKILSHKTGRRCTIREAANVEISFKDFIEFICEQSEFEMDRHWVPQSAAIYHDVIQYDYIGRLEQLDEAQQHIAEIVGINSEWQPNARLNKSGSVNDCSDFFNSDILKLFLSRYRKDFELFNYSTDPAAC